MRFLYSLFASAVCVVSVSAQNSFDDVVNHIVNNNAELQSQQHMISAQRLDDSDANALADPSVSFSRVWGKNHVGNKLQLDVSQEFEWPGVYSARSRVADMGVNVAVTDYDVARFELSNQVRQLLTELVYVRRQKAVIDELMANFNVMSDAVDKAVKGGELTILDQRKMQIERYEIENQLNSILSREQQVIGEIDALTTKPIDLSDIVAYPIQQLLSRNEYIDLVANDPYVINKAVTAEYESLNAKLASQSRMPTLSVGYQHQSEMGDHFNGFTVDMTLPVFQGRNARKAALERSDAADLSREMLVAKRSAEINSTYSELELYRGRIEAYNKVFGDHMYLDLLLKAYKGGQMSVIEYLSEIHYYHQTMLAYVESEYNYNIALTSLNCYNR